MVDVLPLAVICLTLVALAAIGAGKDRTADKTLEILKSILKSIFTRHKDSE